MTAQLADLLRPARAVLFDFDGPICSVFAGLPAFRIARQLREQLEREGYEVDPAEQDPLEVLRLVEPLGGDIVTRIEDALTAAELKAIASAEPTVGGAASLDACARSGRRCAIVTNNSPRAVSTYLRNRRLADVVDAVVGRPYAEPSSMKPSPVTVERALAELGVDAREAVLVGDSTRDVQAAHSVGLACIGYAKRPDKRHHLAAAEVITDSMELLADALASTTTKPAGARAG